MPKESVCHSQLSPLVSTKTSCKSQFLWQWNLKIVGSVSNQNQSSLYVYPLCVPQNESKLYSDKHQFSYWNSYSYLSNLLAWTSKPVWRTGVRLWTAHPAGCLRYKLCCSLCQEARFKYHFGTWLSPISVSSCRVSYLWIWIIFSVVHKIQCQMIGWWGNNQLNRM